MTSDRESIRACFERMNQQTWHLAPKLREEPLSPEEEAQMAQHLAGPDGVVMAYIPGRLLWIEAPLRDDEHAWWNQ